MQHDSERYRIVLALFFVVFFLLFARLVTIEIVDRGKYLRLSKSNAILRKIIYPERGLVYDAKNRVIVDNQLEFNLLVEPDLIANLDTVALCKALDISIEDFNTRLKTIITKNGPYRQSIIERLLTIQQQSYFEENAYRFKGFEVGKFSTRYYPYVFGSHILGYLSEVNTNTINNSKGYYAIGDWIGKIGIEGQYESILRGTRGSSLFLRNNNNKIQSSFENGQFDTPAIAGKNIHLSLDMGLQEIAEKLLTNKRGSVVAINPNTGAILAMASAPGYDPNILYTKNRNVFYQNILSDKNKPFFNRAIQGLYPPGSTFKPFASLLSLQENIIDEDFGVNCFGYYEGCTNKIIKCLHHNPGHASNFFKGLANSCNSYFCTIFKKLLDSRYYSNIYSAYNTWRSYLISFGFGQKMGIDIPGEEKGYIPDTAIFNKQFGVNRLKSCNIITLGIGQDKMLVSPLQMANMTCVIANKGFYYTPHFLASVDNPNQVDIKLMDGFKKKHSVKYISENNYNLVIEAMHDVTKFGTAKNTRVADIDYCAKTGTSQNPHGLDHSWFIAFAPKDHPQIAVAVIIENAGAGSTWAAPIAALVMEQYLKDSLSISSQDKFAELVNTNLLGQQSSK
ncbi:MAG: penicillin-binding protein 2 [Phycisphaerales bacterium]|nr:penicillin-binding protein 2 [Phycisphaerales bacterium]